MKKYLLLVCLFLLTADVFGQQFSQYNTGTLYDSFENPSQRSFIPDSSRQFAFNFFIPNFNANLYLTGNAQTALKSRLFSGYYNTADLQVGNGKNNHINVNANAYSVMFKMFTSLDGNEEVGFFINSKFETRGVASDESIAIFNGPVNFPNNNYTDIFNDNLFYQAYHQIGFTYREQVTKQFALGIKLSALSGILYRNYNITGSSINFDKLNDQAIFSLQGNALRSGETAQSSTIENLGPSFRNPGAAISLGGSYKNPDGLTFQGNIKDLGFIHWNSTSTYSNFSIDTLVKGLSTPAREKNIINSLTGAINGNAGYKGFNSPINGLAEFSVNKSYWLDYDKQFKFSPTFIVSKELFYSGITGALVAPLQYHSYSVTLTSSYNDLNLFNFGAQFMIKSPNAEFFIGSETLFQTGSLIATAITGNGTNQVQATTSQGAFSGASFFIGCSFKFGDIIEHPMNASVIPNGESGFIGRLFNKIFNKDKNY